VVDAGDVILEISIHIEGGTDRAVLHDRRLRGCHRLELLGAFAWAAVAVFRPVTVRWGCFGVALFGASWRVLHRFAAFLALGRVGV
jgi:hypothetical protein